MEEVRIEVTSVLSGIEMDPVMVGIVMGSESDREVMSAACRELEERRIKYEINVLSAHRDPDKVAHYARTAQSRGIKVLIGAAGKAAALPGVLASYSNLPVIGVPIRTSDLEVSTPCSASCRCPPACPWPASPSTAPATLPSWQRRSSTSEDRPRQVRPCRPNWDGAAPSSLTPESEHATASSRR